MFTRKRHNNADLAKKDEDEGEEEKRCRKTWVKKGGSEERRREIGTIARPERAITMTWAFDLVNNLVESDVSG